MLWQPANVQRRLEIEALENIQRRRSFNAIFCCMLAAFLLDQTNTFDHQTKRKKKAKMNVFFPSLLDVVQVCFRRSVWVPHTGERPEGVPETSTSQTVSVFVCTGFSVTVCVCVCVFLFSHAYLRTSSPLCSFLSCSTVDDCPPNQKVSLLVCNVPIPPFKSQLSNGRKSSKKHTRVFIATPTAFFFNCIWYQCEHAHSFA